MTRAAWRAAAEDLAASDARLLSMWASFEANEFPLIWGAFLLDQGVLLLKHPLAAPDADYPRIDDLFLAAAREQRAVADLSGVRADGGDERPWLRHAAWRGSRPPLAPQLATAADASLLPADGGPAALDCYPFVRVDGDGVHEIAVGPVHAGIIEPGHFRFSVVGEKVLRLEERLGYVHKGIERRFESLTLSSAHRLAARVSGDSAVAFSWAYCQALEGLGGVELPARAAWLRALALELERIANHLGDLGALGNDAGFAFGLAQFSRMKERLLRACGQTFGQRYLFDFIVPGGCVRDLGRGDGELLQRAVQAVLAEAHELRRIFDEHPGVRDRFVAAGIVTPPLAQRLGLVGPAGRASGQAVDLRVDLPCIPYGELAVRKCSASAGDVAARVAIRFDELDEAARLVGLILERLPEGPCAAQLSAEPPAGFGLGLIEGWRGPVLVALTSAPAGRIACCHVHDPSSLNWLALEHAVIGNIVPDFPLINKSFNLSYSGHDR